MTKFKVGDKVSILNASRIQHAYILGFETGGIYDVVEVDSSERIAIITEKAGIRLDKQEQKYIEKVKNMQEE